MPKGDLLDSIKKELVYYLIIFPTYYLLPFLIRDTGSAMLMLIIIMPFIIFVTSFVYGLRKGFHIRYSIIVSALYVPSMLIFYNMSAYIYIIAYFFLALTANCIALLFRDK